MIIPNGYIRMKQKTGGGLDSSGYPVPVTSSLCGYIECQFKATSMNLGGKTGTGEPQIRQSYTILVEETCHKCFVGESLVLYDDAQTEIGEFEILRIQPLPSVCQIRLYI